MKKQFIYLILAFILFSCGGNSEKAQNREATNTGQPTGHEELTVLQEQAVKEKYLNKGMEIATLTQSELLKVVQGAMAIGGPAYAVDYCKIEALDLKDSLSALNNCTIRRLSAKYRNPADKPVTELEKEQLKSFEMLHSEEKPLNPAVFIVGEEVEYYQPIFIGAGACLLCHGDPATHIAGETMNMIRKLYPDDLATGYALNDFRGVWKITFQHGS